MIGLIVARIINHRRDSYRKAERQRLVPMLLEADFDPLLPNASKPSSALLANLAIELIQMVRGSDKETFVAKAFQLGVPLTLRHRLEHGSPRVRLAAAEALADFGDPSSLEQLHATLDDRNADVRLAAALALAAVGDAPPVRDLIEKLGLGSKETSMLVVSLFQDIAANRPHEIKALISDPKTNIAVKVSAIDALSASADYSIVPLIADLVLKAEPGAEEIPRYLRALGAFAHPAGSDAVEHALASTSWWVRSAAAEAAGKIGMSAASSRLAALLDDPEWWVRFRAGEALTRLGPAGQHLLSDVAREGSQTARIAARLTLAEHGIPA